MNMDQPLALPQDLELAVKAFSNLSLREGGERTEKMTGTAPNLPRLCSIYLRDAIGLLPRDACSKLRLVSGRLDDELSSYPSSMLPKKILSRVELTTRVRLGSNQV